MKKFKIKELIKKHKKATAAVLCTTVLIGGGTIYKMTNSEPSEIEDQMVQERTVKIKKMDINNSVTVEGKVGSGEISTVTTALTQKVKSVNVKVGDYVEAGDVICVLDDSDIKKEIAKKKEEINKEKTTLQTNYENLVKQLNALKEAKSLSNAEQDKLVQQAQEVLSKAATDLSSYTAVYESEKYTYNIMINAISKKQNAYEEAENNKKTAYEAWLSSGGQVDSAEYKNYQNAQEKLAVKKEELAEAKHIYDYDNISANYNEALSTYNEKISSRDSAQDSYDSAVAMRQSTINSNEVEIEALASSVEEAQKQLQEIDNNDELIQLEEDLSKTELKAETSGKVTDLKVNVGSICEGDVATIQSTDKLILAVTIPEYYIQKVSTGMKVIISSDTSEDKFNGELITVSPIAEEGEGVGFAAEISVEEPKGMYIGTTAKAEIILSSKKNILAVPIDSVAEEEGISTIFIKQADGSFAATEVELGAKNDYYVEVSGENIKEGIEIRANALNEEGIY